MRYLRITKTLKDVGIIVPASELYDYIDSSAPYFKSLYYYGDDALAYSKANKGSIRGYRGEVTTNEITFDIDSPDLEISHSNTLKLLDYLESVGLYNDRAAKIAFSGSKGFHIHINTEHTFSPGELKRFCMFIGKQVGFDKKHIKLDSSVYNTNRIFRIANTPNEKSGLYKVEMLSSDLRKYSMDEIREAAKTTQPVYEYEAAIPEAIVLEHLQRVPKPKLVLEPVELPESALTGELPPCIAKLQDGDMADGESNAGLLRLANHYRRAGYSKEQTRHKLFEAATARITKHPGTNEITSDKINQEILYPIFLGEGYTFTCSDPFLLDKCGGLCNHKPVPAKELPSRTASFRSKPVVQPVEPVPEPVKPARNVSFRQGAANIPVEDKVRLMGFKKLRDTADSYDDFVKTAVKHRVLTGINEIDSRVKIIPNGLTIINARPGVGKTTIAMNILENVSKSGQIGAFYCVDMDESEYYTKAASKALKISPDEAMDLFFSEDPKLQDLKQEAHREADKAVENILFNYEKHLTIEKIEEDLKSLQAAGQKPYVVVIDYIQKIHGASEYHNATNILIALKRLISEYKVCIIALSQIPGGIGGDEETPVLSARAARGGSIYEENASVCINLWRPLKFLDDRDLYMGYAVSKNRMGECFSGVLGFRGAISQISDLTDEQKLEAQAEIEAYNELKSATSKKRGQFR